MSVVDPATRLRQSFVGRWAWLIAAVGCFFVVVATRHSDHVDAGVFRYAGDALFSGRGLHLYADHPEVQIGPLGLIAGVLGGFASTSTTPITVAVSAVLLIAVLVGIAAFTAMSTPDGRYSAPASMTILGCSVAYPWALLIPFSAHIDDALAIVFVVWAGVAGRRNHPVLAGVLIALGAAAKPWAAFFLVLLLFNRRRSASLGAAAAVSLLVWGPFFVAAPTSLGRLGEFRIDAGPGSLWRLVGLDTAPSYERLLQCAVAAVGGYLLYRVGRRDVVLLWIFAIRLLLDAGTFDYYLAGVVVGTAVVDVVTASRGAGWRVLPFLTPLTVLLLGVGDPSVAGSTPWSRITCLAGVVLLALVKGRRVARPEHDIPVRALRSAQRDLVEITPFGLNSNKITVDA